MHQSMSHRGRRLKTLLGATAAVAALILAACSTDTTDSEPTVDSSDNGEGSDTPFRAVVISSGPENDAAWSNSVFDGVQELADNDDVEVTFVGSLIDDADIVQQGSAFASDGVDMILMMVGSATSAANEIATQFPDVLVCQGPWSPSEEEIAAFPDNLCVWNLKQQDGTFLAGVLAGLVTQTDQISSVAGMNFPAVVRQPEGFVLGARCVNPDVSDDIQYTGSFDDVAAAQSAATTQIAAGSDVIMSAVDGAVSGLFGAARDADGDVWVIPSYYDSYEQAPDVVLTSVLYNLNGIVVDMVSRAATGEVTGQSYQPYNYANLGVGELAPFYDNPVVTEEIQAQFSEIEEKLRSGEITVPDEDGADAPLSVEGAGSTIDPASIGC